MTRRDDDGFQFIPQVIAGVEVCPACLPGCKCECEQESEGK